LTSSTATDVDNSGPTLQRLIADMQLLQSKLHQFSTQSPAPAVNVQPNTQQSTSRSLVSSDNTDTRIAQLRQQYDAEVLLHVIPLTSLGARGSGKVEGI